MRLRTENNFYRVNRNRIRDRKTGDGQTFLHGLELGELNISVTNYLWKDDVNTKECYPEKCFYRVNLSGEKVFSREKTVTGKKRSL